ncbi:hypothetical protein PISMIDRAFT_676558 [Pisolithus microcarpus 441]|uniref:Uncharacterized protein n=1 Tax=Pisolithus microcarpus 441 TaxID=765257 RepID=A0A0D0A1V0_9AGAM|nr:hypothetical protein PISMIDRAFT_676558 [Pisolithus microcarpus 441]
MTKNSTDVQCHQQKLHHILFGRELCWRLSYPSARSSSSGFQRRSFVSCGARTMIVNGSSSRPKRFHIPASPSRSDRSLGETSGDGIIRGAGGPGVM